MVVHYNLREQVLNAIGGRIISGELSPPRKDERLKKGPHGSRRRFSRIVGLDLWCHDYGRLNRVFNAWIGFYLGGGPCRRSDYEACNNTKSQQRERVGIEPTQDVIHAPKRF